MFQDSVTCTWTIRWRWSSTPGWPWWSSLSDGDRTKTSTLACSTSLLTWSSMSQCLFLFAPFLLSFFIISLSVCIFFESARYFHCHRNVILRALSFRLPYFHFPSRVVFSPRPSRSCSFFLHSSLYCVLPVSTLFCPSSTLTCFCLFSRDLQTYRVCALSSSLSP